MLAGPLEFLREFEHPLQGSESLVDGQSEIAVDERDVDVTLIALDRVIHRIGGLLGLALVPQPEYRIPAPGISTSRNQRIAWKVPVEGF